jgi:hypothetical protein
MEEDVSLSQTPLTLEELRLKVITHNRWVMIRAVGALLLGSLMCFLAYRGFTTEIAKIQAAIPICFVALLGAAIIVTAGLSLLPSKRCPNCDAKDSTRKDKKKPDTLIDIKNDYQTVVVQVRNSRGTVIQSQEQQVSVQVKSYELHYKCSVCGYESIKTRETRT